MMTARSDRFAVVFDTETTGLIDNSAKPLKDQPHIIELAAVKLRISWAEDREEWDLKEEDFYSSLFHHPKLPEDTPKITGITQDMVNLAPSFTSQLRYIQAFFLGTNYMVGHNLSYDRDMLFTELRRLGMEAMFPYPPRHICTVEASETLKGFRLGLNDLHEELLGVRFSEHHRAEPDTRATARCFIELVKRKVIKL